MAYRKRSYRGSGNRSYKRRSYSRRSSPKRRRTTSRTRDVRIIIEQQPAGANRYPGLLNKVNPGPKKSKF